MCLWNSTIAVNEHVINETAVKVVKKDKIDRSFVVDDNKIKL